MRESGQQKMSTFLYVKYLGSKLHVCYQSPWKPLEMAINQRCFTYLGILLSPVLQEDLWRIMGKSAPATAADPVASASTRLLELGTKVLPKVRNHGEGPY